MRKVLANTTPLIALANIDRLDLLNKLYGTIMQENRNNDRLSLVWWNILTGGSFYIPM